MGAVELQNKISFTLLHDDKNFDGNSTAPL